MSMSWTKKTVNGWKRFFAESSGEEYRLDEEATGYVPYRRGGDGFWKPLLPHGAYPLSKAKELAENDARRSVRSNPSTRYRKITKRRNPSDAQVIKAFTEQRAASSSRLHTDGRRLDGLWMGGNGIAVWEGGKIHFSDLGSKAAQSVQKAVAKEAPRNWIGAGSEWALPKRRNPLSPYARMQHKAGFKAPPKPKFKIGYYVEDNYGDGDLHTRPGRVTFVGSYTEPYAAYEKGGVAYEGHSGGYKYKVQEPDGRVLWRDEQRLRRIKAPRSRKNPPSSGLGGTYAIMHANPFGLFKRKPSPKFAVGNAVSYKAGGATGVVLGKQWHDGAWHYEISWPKGYSATGTTLEHEGILRHARRNPDLSGPLTITHDGPDLVITHKVNPSNRWGQSFKKGDTVNYRGSMYTYVKLAPASDFSRTYGRQAILKSSNGYETKAGLDDLSLAKSNPASRAPFGWAKVESGVVAKISRSSRKPGRGWGAINTSGTRVGDRAYLDGGDVYLR